MKQSDYEKFMGKAIEACEKSIERGQTPFGCVIVKGGKIIARAHNTVVYYNDPTAHAEVNAIRLAGKKLKSVHLKDCILFSSCEPCPMCFSAAHWANVKEVVYAATIEDAESLGFRELRIHNKDFSKKGSKIKLVPEILRKEAIKVMKKWKGKPY
ncbi:nucleoside deaminase [Candidatus Micrarchaeota archaeon]|nr:nucleoside deaminase [Candidatus Micrarchaeota archaeon]